jgi:ubiquinone/menaquinone biosynthesis C-methylase UbiE
MSPLHKATKRDYLARVNDPEYPKAKAAELAKQWGYDYWDGDRRINYGGYKYIPGRWTPVAKLLAEHYQLRPGNTVLDIGCGKGFLLYELSLCVPGLDLYGLDISRYAIENSHDLIKNRLRFGTAEHLPFDDYSIDLIISINTLHNLKCFQLEKALKEIVRVSSKNSYLCIESYRNEVEKANLLYWQVTCESFFDPQEWAWWFEKTGFAGDHSFIFFE